jgi:predicted ABC-type transport system involved in lysophospholipase L1 biosynthesis ATPase subunit
VAISSSSSIFLPLFSAVENVTLPLLLDGPPQSLFGRYAMNDQVMLELVYSW